MNGHRKYSTSCISLISFSSNHVRTLLQNGASLTHLPSIASAQFPVLSEGEAFSRDPYCSPFAAASSCQICPFTFNNLQDAPPFQCFCIVARGCHTPPVTASAQVASGIFVLKNARRRTVQAIVQGRGAVYLTIQLHCTARQYASHAEPGSPAGVPYAGGHVARRGKPLQERPLS